MMGAVIFLLKKNQTTESVKHNETRYACVVAESLDELCSIVMRKTKLIHSELGYLRRYLSTVLKVWPNFIAACNQMGE